MAVRIYIEIGHEASIRNKKTQEGFTHDWEVFVRGCDGAEIQYFVEKVVFYLHETFPKPKRVVKEPPYSVKESGYAGFNLPIDVYLRNNNEPKKIRFNYDLHLQNVGPPIINVLKEKYVFTSTTDDFKAKLLKGGGTIGNSSNLQEFNDSRTSLDDKNQMTNKPKLSGCDIIRKQTKTGEPSREFNAIFGSPIFTSKTNLDVKQQQQQLQPKPDNSKNPDKSRMKHSPQKDSHRDKDKKERADSKNKDDKKQKEKSKDRDRSSKDKTLKKERSPRPKSPSPRSRSPKSPARFSSPSGTKHKDLKSHDKRDKPDDRKQKKEKRSKEHKEGKHADEQKLTTDKHKENKVRPDKKDVPKIKIDPPTSPKVDKKDKNKDKSLPKDIPKEEKSSDKPYSSEKYKHKKKDKEKREKKEEKHKSDKKTAEVKPNLFKTEPQMSNKKEKQFSQPPLTIDDSSSSSSFSSTSSVERSVEKKSKSETKSMKDEKNLKFKKERNYQENAIKCKRKSNSVEADEPPEKVHKEHSNNNSDAEEDEEMPAKTFLVKTEPEEDYFGVLRDLQHKIMGLKDNEDLQKVVQLIAETGRYEVSAHTFDFDLCLLDRSTVRQLQDFFTNET